MKRIITMSALIMAICVCIPSYIEADKIPPRQLKDYAVSELVQHFAKQYSVSAKKMDYIIMCESSGNVDAHNLTKFENSWGLSQINLKAHPEITVDQARDKVFATEYLANHLAAKDVNWTCDK